MGYTVVRAEARLERMITWFAGLQSVVTDFIVGGKTRTKFEAVAVEMEAQDFQISQAIQQAIPVAIYQAFGFTLLPAVKASGSVRFSTATLKTTDILISPGTAVATLDGRTYKTTTLATLGHGAYHVDAPVLADLSGSTANTPSGTITVIKSAVSGIDTVTNLADIVTGKEAETESERVIRFKEYIKAIAHATADALAYGAKQAILRDTDGSIKEQVAAVYVNQSKTGAVGEAAVGFPEVYVYNGVGAASTDLLQRVRDVLNGYLDTATDTKITGWKAAGDIVVVSDATRTPVAVAATVKVKAGYDSSTVTTGAISAVVNYFSGLTIGDPVYSAAIVDHIMAVPGISNVTFAASPDRAVSLGNVYIAGDITAGVA